MTAAEQLDHRILGPFEVRRDGVPLALGGPRQRAVLAILALAANTPVSADALIDRLWGDGAPASATATLQAYISELRRVLEPDRAPRSPAEVLRSGPGGYTLVVPDGTRDADRVERQVALARDALAAGDPDAAATAARAALAEWRGPTLDDFADEPFAAADIRRWEETRLRTVELRMEAELEGGRHAEVVAELDGLVAEHPLRERLRGQLMLALYRSGRQAEALEVAKAGRTLLAEELGLDPDPALQELEGAILRQDPSLAPAARAVATADPGGPSAASDELVGRSAERGTLELAFDAASSGTARMVLIGGEPGIGKTHLAHAFAADVAGARVLWGLCHESGGAPPFWPWRQVLRSLATTLEPGELAGVLGVDAGVVADVVPELAAHLGDGGARPADAEAARFHFFDAATRLLVHAARTDPLVVVLEDLHWADESSLALLRFIVGQLRGTGVLVLATYRSVAAADRSLLAGTLGALAREPIVERIVLPGLDEAACAELVRGVLGEEPAGSLVTDIRERTEGNPLFTIHLALLLRGALGRPDEAGAIVREQVPPAMADLIELRVSERTPTTRRLLEVAAVVGRSFQLRTLAEVDGASTAEVLAAMEEAVDAGLVVEDQSPGAFRFTHALMREGIVAGLGRTRAATLHGQVGDALAARGVDPESLPALAHHYWEAAPVGWSEQALSTATAAAASAIARFAYEEAERHLGRALRLTGDLPAGGARDRTELAVRMQAASHLMRSRGYAVAEVGEACQRARDLAERVEAPDLWLVASWGLAAHHLVRGEHPAAVTIGESLYAAGTASDNTVMALAGLLGGGIPLLYLDEPDRARQRLEEAVALAAAAGPEALSRFPQDLALGARSFLAWATWADGDPDAAEQLRRAAVDRAREVGGYDEVFALMVSAQLGVLRETVDQVLQDTARMLEVCGEMDFRHLSAHARVMQGWALSRTGRTDEGVASVESGVAYFREHESSTRIVHNLALQAEVLEAAGRTDDAVAATRALVDAIETSEECFFVPRARAVVDRLLGAAGRS